MLPRFTGKQVISQAENSEKSVPLRAATTLSAITWREAQAKVASQKHWAVCPNGFLAPGGRLLESAARKASPKRRNDVIWMAYLWGVIGHDGSLAHSG